MKKVSVMIVEDSRVVSEFLRYIIDRDPRLQVVASVPSGEEALRELAHTKADVISLDIRLPGMNGLEATKRIMTEYPTPIVVVSSDVEDDELKISMNALRAGALAVVQKPVGLSHADYEDLANLLCTKLYIMSQVRVIRQRYRPGDPLPFPATPTPERPSRQATGTPRILGIVASTGGPGALVRVLGDLSPDFSAPIVIVQHITPGFVRGFVSWLGDCLPNFRVVEAGHHLALQPRTVYVAPADSHTLCAKNSLLQLSSAPALHAQRPSGTHLFRSMAETWGADAVGVLLTGMGEDGAAGLRDLHRAGAYTIAEDESTAVVYGMPAAAVKLGATCAVLPLPEIGARLNALFLRKGGSSTAHE
jgi:two-component system chemotaxis response regulator CheB